MPQTETSQAEREQQHGPGDCPRAPSRRPARVARIVLALLVVGLGLAGSGGARAATGPVRYTLLHEAGDWTFLAGVTVANFAISPLDPLTDEPLIDSPYTDRPEVHTTVKGSWLHIESGVLSALILTLPNHEGWLGHTGYANLKGFWQGQFTANTLMNLTKVVVGRKRPVYDAVPDDPDSRKSFFSGHASNIWYDWTYVTLFAFEHLGDNHNPWHLAAKILLAATGASISSWVCWTRVDESKHFVSDVVVGGLEGAAFATLFYAYQNEWLFPVYDREPASGGSRARALSPGLSPLPGGFALTLGF